MAGDIGESLNSGSINVLQASAAHGALSGVMSVLNGGKFGHGFASGFVSKYAGEEIDLKKRIPNSKSTRIFTAGIIGGTVSAATGGKFANGAIQSAIQCAFNSEGLLDDEPARPFADAENVFQESHKKHNSLELSKSIEAQVGKFDINLAETTFNVTTGEIKHSGIALSTSFDTPFVLKYDVETGKLIFEKVVIDSLSFGQPQLASGGIETGFNSDGVFGAGKVCVATQCFGAKQNINPITPVIDAGRSFINSLQKQWIQVQKKLVF